MKREKASSSMAYALGLACRVTIKKNRSSIYYKHFQDIETRYREIHLINQSKNDTAIAKAREAYDDDMEYIYTNAYNISLSEVEDRHNQAEKKAMDIFFSYRTSKVENDNVDTYKEILIKVSCKLQILLK